jgi:hypothetical protein
MGQKMCPLKRLAAEEKNAAVVFAVASTKKSRVQTENRRRKQ